MGLLARAVGLLTVLGVSGGVPALAGPITISEALYDAPGRDDGSTFLEIFGPPGFLLDGFQVVGVNGNGGGITQRFSLDPWRIPLDGFLVLADATRDGVTFVADADVLIFDLDWQNGPDSVQILRDGAIVDALAYGVFSPGDVYAGEGRPAPIGMPGTSLARRYADIDTGDNYEDFLILASPTPGRGPRSVPVPEPAGLLLLGVGLVVLWGVRMRRGITSRR